MNVSSVHFEMWFLKSAHVGTPDGADEFGGSPPTLLEYCLEEPCS